MKYQEIPTKFHGAWRYQAQFQDPSAMKRAKDWLASRSCKDLLCQESSIYTNDLQIIFEMRIHFDRTIKVIRVSTQP